jgi:hypothetical protein
MGWAKRAARGTTRFGPAKHGPARIRMGWADTAHYGGLCLGRCRGTWAGTGTARLSGWHDLARYIFPYTLKFVMFVIV